MKDLQLQYWVLCREDRTEDDEKGKYVLAKSEPFDDYDNAKEYAATISESRDAIVTLQVLR